MQISILLAQQIAQLFLILIMGYAVVKAGLLKASDSKVLSVLMVYLVCPCMILNAFQIEDTPDIRRGLVYAMIVAAAMHVVLLAFTALLRRPLKLDVIEQVNTIYSNAGALVIPLVQALLGSEYVIYSCAFIIVQTVLIWTHANACLQGSFSFQWKKLLENVNILAILAGLAGEWVADVLLRLRGRIERIAVALRLRVIGVVGIAVALLALCGLLCRLTERELLRGLGIAAGLAALLALCLSRGRTISAIFRGRTIQRSCGRGLACGRCCRRSRRGGDHRALALGGGVVRDGLGGGSVGSGLRRLLIGSEGGRGNRGLLLAGIAGVAGINRVATHKRVLRLGVAGIGSTIGVFVIPRGLVDALRVKFVSHCCSFS